MTPTDIDNFRQQLLSLRERLQGDVSHLKSEATRAPVEDCSDGLNVSFHTTDSGADNFEQELSFSLLENEEQTLEEIADALVRIEQGAFGRCEECKKNIPRARLQALPYTRHCVECARKLQQSS